MTRPLALITGGLHRIGAAIGAALAGAGYDLVLHSGHGGQPDDDVRAAADAAGAEIFLTTADLSQRGAADRLFDDVVALAGRAPLALVNNAAMFGDGDGWAMDEDALHDHLRVNMIAPVRLTQHVAMAARDVRADGDVRAAGDGATRASIIHILDQRVFQPVTDQAAYTMAKQALWQALRTQARALAPYARVNGVAPGLTLPAPDYAPGQMERMAAAMPLERLASPQDIADAVLFLLRADAITGQTICVDGGANLAGWPRDFAFL